MMRVKETSDCAKLRSHSAGELGILINFMKLQIRSLLVGKDALSFAGHSVLLAKREEVACSPKRKYELITK